jgi:predicted acylesterase/phospholipase RssA
MFQMLLFFCFLANVSLFSALSAKVCNILSFSGAGSFGAVEVGILDKLTHSSNMPAFDMLTGVSAGGLNVGFLSYYSANNNALSKGCEGCFKQGITELKNTYFQMTNDTVFQHNMGQIARTWSYYDTAPLRKTIESKLAPLSYRGFTPIPALIGSTNLNDGRFQIFEFHKESKLRQIQIMMATSAIPLAFPPENIQGTYYVDGGAVANEIINGVESFFEPPTMCDKYNFTFITASEGLAQVDTIDSLNDYVRRVVKVVLTDFNNELAEIIDAPCSDGTSSKASKKGTIQICHPSAKGGDYLSQYSSMDFSYGKELYEIGYNHFTCDSYPYC